MRELIAAEPHLNQTEIAARLGISRARVGQIARSEGLTVARGVRGIGRRGPGRPPGPPIARVITGGVRVPLSHTVVGTIGELMAAADLMARGWMVFFPFTRTGACDLIAMSRDANVVERIEVRCGHRYEGRVVWTKPDVSRSDRRAIILTGEPVVYDPPFPA